jgi:hypothetical protein
MQDHLERDVTIQEIIADRHEVRLPRCRSLLEIINGLGKMGNLWTVF